MRILFTLLLTGLLASNAHTQSCDCPYPIIFLHGYTGNQSTFDGTYDDGNFSAIFGPHSDIFHAVVNATTIDDMWGSDGVPDTSDDDVLFFFNNEPNVMAPGCVYSINFENFWNEDESSPEILINDGSAPGLFDADSNESSCKKQGYALSGMIESVLNSNPDKDKVIIVGHSMGGLEAREYLQRTDANGDQQWWLNPNVPDGHQVKKLVTSATPHRGSNFFGNPWPLKGEEEELTRDGLPDIASEATRDLRWSYSCGFLGLFSCSGVYLFGGNEADIPFGYWNDDVNCDGDEDDVLEGINESGSPDPWDGTADNPNMPLPETLRYTYITSDVGTGGDLVVDRARQWIYSGSTPEPSDGTAHRLTDTLLTDVNHLAVDDDVDVVVRALDEGDYPAFAWDINLDHSSKYAGLTQVRSADVPDGPNTDDPDWWRFYIPNGTTDDICIILEPNTNLAGSLDYFSSPANYDDMSVAGDVTSSFGTGGAAVTITLASGSYVAGADNYFRVIHEAVGYTDWHNAYKIEVITKTPVPVELVQLRANQVEEHVALDWITASEVNNELFEVWRSADMREWEKIGSVAGFGTTNESKQYSFVDKTPYIGKNFYRLNQVDFDGSSVLSHVVQCAFLKAETTQIAIYPNPVEDQLFIQLRHIEEDFNLEIYDALGRRIHQQFYRLENSDLFSILLPFGEWPSGSYTLRMVSTSDVVITEQFVKR